MKNIFKYLMIICIGGLLHSCYYDAYIEEEFTEPFGGGETPTEVFFQADIQPIFARCVGCHGGNLNPDLRIRGILLTMYDKRNKLSSQVEKEARDFFNDKVYLTVIPRNVRLSEAPSHGMPVLIYDKSCPGSKSYFSFTDEFINQEETIGSAA